MNNQTAYEIKAHEPTAATVRVSIAREDVERQIEGVYVRYAHELAIPGFRKGRVPRGVLESRFGREAFVNEAKDELQRKHLAEALDQLALRPVSMPEVAEVSSDNSESYVFEASFSVLPEVTLPPYRGLEAEVPPPMAVSDEEVNEALEEIRGRFGTLENREGDLVSEGDIVRVRERDAEWDTRAEASNPLTGRLIGLHLGEAAVIEAPAREGGQPFRTKLEVLGLRQLVLPEIDDDLAKDAGFESLAQLRDDVRRRLQDARDGQRRHLIEGRLLDLLVEKAAIPLPEPFVLELVEEELERMRQAFERPPSPRPFAEVLQERGTSEESIRTDLRASVERRLRRELALRALGNAEGVALDDAALEEIARREAEEGGEDPVRFVAHLKAEDRWEDYRSGKVNEKLLTVLRESAVLREATPAGEEG
ncbi:MAG: trigger factor [Candidatus Bipolaricaulota bacterium]